MNSFTPTVEPPLVAVLAAGSARRFGGGKLDAPLAGKPLGRWSLDAVGAAGLPGGLLISGPDGVAFADGAGWEILPNPRADQGLGTSLALAACTALERDARALLVLLADMPLIDPAFLAEIGAVTPPAATCYPDGDVGVPALFGQAQLPALAELTGDHGAAALLALLDGITVLAPPKDMLRDVDRPEDLAAMERQLSAR